MLIFRFLKNMILTKPFVCLSVSLIMILAACGFALKEKKSKMSENDLPQIKERGELIVLTANTSTSFFDYRGESMGFQYELAKFFSQTLGLELKIKVIDDQEKMVDSLLAGAGDLIAYNLPITNKRKERLIYCGEEKITHQVLIQRKGKGLLTDVTQLVGKKVYVRPGKYYERLSNLNEELGGGIDICKLTSDSVTEEGLIMAVADGKINYTVADNEVAKINRTYYHNLNIDLKISFDQRSAWAVRKTSVQLAKAVDEWFREKRDSPEVKAVERRYFELNKQTTPGSILSVEEGKISSYDELFRKYAKDIDWDWRLLAALVYTESNFNPNVVSWAGAKGLMQLMPRTARAMGVPAGKERDPEESIKGGVKYIRSLQTIFQHVPDKDERIKFVLASYNAGTGHILDAMALTEKYGRDKNVWENNVAHYVLLKSEPEFYQDPVCKNGYFRGTETYRFVHDVLSRLAFYKQRIGL